jgi:hypothetical protein
VQHEPDRYRVSNILPWLIRMARIRGIIVANGVGAAASNSGSAGWKIA